MYTYIHVPVYVYMHHQQQGWIQKFLQGEVAGRHPQNQQRGVYIQWILYSTEIRRLQVVNYNIMYKHTCIRPQQCIATRRQ